MPLVLASASPRRRDLLATVGIPVARVQPSQVDEQRQPGEPPLRYVRRLARAKALAVSAPDHWVLAADTIVHLADEVFEKPVDDAHARHILGRLAGRWHQVSTAWCLAWGSGSPPQGLRNHLAHRTTRVRFRVLSAPEIAAYVATGEGRDKAGAYGIQGLGASLVDRLVGNYPTVVGLPLGDVVQHLNARGISPRTPP